ncbi:MAG: hypothetical protein IH941_14400 [Acidobacteria bacterium]|nr:hypothetical protein [Acidobacteriota bacterium]
MVRNVHYLSLGDLERFTELRSALDQVETELQLRGPWDLPEDYKDLSTQRNSLYTQMRALFDGVVA